MCIDLFYRHFTEFSFISGRHSQSSNSIEMSQTNRENKKMNNHKSLNISDVGFAEYSPGMELITVLFFLAQLKISNMLTVINNPY